MWARFSSITECVFQVSCPTYNKDLQRRVESVQRKAARWICNDWRRTSSPTKMLDELHLKTLQERRTIAKLKLLHSFYYGHKYLLPSLLPSKVRCSDLRFKPILARTQAYNGSFFPSTVAVWNKLPRDIVNTICPLEFSKHLVNSNLVENFIDWLFYL